MRWLTALVLAGSFACGSTDTETEAEPAPRAPQPAAETPPRPAEPEVDTSHWKLMTLRVLGMT
jgi:hypothetical protein